MKNSDDRFSELKTRFEDFNNDLQILGKKLKSAAVEARSDLEKSFRILQSRKEELEKAGREFADGSGKAWEGLKQGSESAWKSLQEAWKKAREDWERS